ncbi:hypothetical protein [Salidesulfovibrio onnuriiensis]|uniref:hypothetical protein n=1 Tax=Salidesulfovibrio onnuriiensis TaxID=2583823 RepID=UPI0011CC7A9F|nr:hypothetical protein [Salidesulfovibrio onnuriiensis]
MAEAQLSLEKLSKGWIDFYLKINDEGYDLTVSSMFSEPLRDLCDCLSDAISGNAGEWANGPRPHFEFEWLGEGWLYEWTVRPGDDGLLHAAVKFSGNRVLGERKLPVWDTAFSMDPRELARQLWTQCSALLRSRGFTTYRALWGKDFPLAQLLSLRALTEQGLGAPVQEEMDYLRELING